MNRKKIYSSQRWYEIRSILVSVYVYRYDSVFFSFFFYFCWFYFLIFFAEYEIRASSAKQRFKILFLHILLLYRRRFSLSFFLTLWTFVPLLWMNFFCLDFCLIRFMLFCFEFNTKTFSTCLLLYSLLLKFYTDDGDDARYRQMDRMICALKTYWLFELYSVHAYIYIATS